jgi:hypothetical protein
MKTAVEFITSYPLTHIFNKERMTGKELKLEKRLHDHVVPKFWSISNSNFARMRELLNDINASLLLGVDDRVVPQILEATGRLEAVFNKQYQLIQNSIKGEPALKEYYKELPKADWYEYTATTLVALILNRQWVGGLVDMWTWKPIYYKGKKDETNRVT